MKRLSHADQNGRTSKAKRLSHVDRDGRASMVDVGGKNPQRRVAKASGHIGLSESTLAIVRQNSIEKGDVLTVAEVAGIQAAKRTFELIPLCHPIELTKVDVKASVNERGISIASEVSCIGRTGVEMEALVAVSVALLTVYDMCKAVDKAMRMGEIQLIEKAKENV